MRGVKNNKHFVLSIAAHVGLLIFFILGLDFSSPLPVFENTNKNDVISAVVLGDTKKSKILPNVPLPKLQSIAKADPKPEPVKKVTPPPPVKEDVIAIKEVDKKKLAEQKALEKKKQQELLAKDFLADFDKVKKKQEKQKQVALKTQFEKTLHDQAEKTLREQFLDEDFKVQGTQSRQSQGEVNKYKALILQAISEHWVVPTQANKKLYCELMIRVAPGGMVLDVQVTKTSGDPSLDSSARAAVMKASPLPVPADSGAFEPFRQFVLKVKPENILG